MCSSEGFSGFQIWKYSAGMYVVVQLAAWSVCPTDPFTTLEPQDQEFGKVWEAMGRRLKLPSCERVGRVSGLDRINEPVASHYLFLGVSCVIKILDRKDLPKRLSICTIFKHFFFLFFSSVDVSQEENQSCQPNWYPNKCTRLIKPNSLPQWISVYFLFTSLITS